MWLMYKLYLVCLVDFEKKNNHKVCKNVSQWILRHLKVALKLKLQRSNS